MPISFQNCVCEAGTFLNEKKIPQYASFYCNPVTGLLSEAHSAIEGVMLRCTPVR